MILSQLSRASLVLFAALLAGCPRDQYVVELTPRGAAVERTLRFHREDGKGTDGAVNYQAFPPDRLATITRCYLTGETSQDGHRHTVRGEFTGSLPRDVGGVGTWDHVTTALGSATVYVERFRGTDDLATRYAAKIAAADQLADLIVGWSEMTLGRVPQYSELRRFLDGEFRQDLKNFSFYMWFAEVGVARDPKAEVEFGVRLGQYLAERGYLTMRDLSVVVAGLWMDDSSVLLRLAQRQIATRLGISKDEPLPAALAFLVDPDALEKSWVEHLATTRMYAAKVETWEAQKTTQPDLKKPEAAELGHSLFMTLLEPQLTDREDHLVVRLSLPAPPIDTNGSWDPVQKRVVWESHLSRKPDAAHLPVLCCARWSEAAVGFQQEHFGDVILTGEPLLQYCFWYATLDRSRAAEWDTLLASLRPDLEIWEKIAAFRFTGEPPKSKAEPETPTRIASDFPRKLFAPTSPRRVNDR